MTQDTLSPSSQDAMWRLMVPPGADPYAHETEPPAGPTTPTLEARIRAAVEAYAIYSGSGEIIGYDGWSGTKISKRLVDAQEAVAPFPSDLAGTWAEYYRLTALIRERSASQSRSHAPAYIGLRVAVLERILNRKPEPTIEGLRTRVTWLQHLIEIGAIADSDAQITSVAALLQDLATFSRKIAMGQFDRLGHSGAKGAFNAPQPYRTNMDKQRRVLAVLSSEPHLSDRAIARRCSVSAQMVGNWRRSLLSADRPARQLGG